MGAIWRLHSVDVPPGARLLYNKGVHILDLLHIFNLAHQEQHARFLQDHRVVAQGPLHWQVAVAWAFQRVAQ